MVSDDDHNDVAPACTLVTSSGSATVERTRWDTEDSPAATAPPRSDSVTFLEMSRPLSAARIAPTLAAAPNVSIVLPAIAVIFVALRGEEGKDGVARMFFFFLSFFLSFFFLFLAPT